VDGIALEHGFTGIQSLADDTSVINSTIRYTEDCAILFSKGNAYINNAMANGNDIEDVGCGIYFYQSNNGKAISNRINKAHNRWTRADHEAVALQGGNFNRFEYNYITNSWLGIDLYGASVESDNPATNNTVSNNYVAYADYLGIVLGGDNKTYPDGTVRGPVYDNWIYNNVVRHSGEASAYCGRDCVFGGGIAGAGMRANNTPVTGRNYFYNNTLYANSRNFAGTHCRAGRFTFLNNISLYPTVRHLDFSGNETAGCAIYNDFASSIADHNLYWPAAGTGLFDWHGVYNSFDSYAQNTDRDDHGLAEDPLLQGDPATGDFHWAGTPSIIPGAGDYRLTINSPAIDRGTPVGLTTDITANPVQGVPDIGAYEGGALADLGLTISDTPDPALIGDTISYTINVTNNGPSPANGVMVTGTLPSCNLGTIASGASASCTRTISATKAGMLDQVMTVGSEQFDHATVNNTASITTQVLPSCATGSYWIYGRVRLDSETGPSMAGVALRLTKANCGDLRISNSNSGSNYTFSGLNNGVYSLAPSKTGCGFTPANRTITVDNGNVYGWDKAGFAGSGVDCTQN
jgi:uncharacterized repeat protein (TIGR01451 family)